MDAKTVDFNQFTVMRGDAAKYLGISVYGLDKLKLPFTKIGARGRVRYRQSDLDRVKQASLHNADALTR